MLTREQIEEIQTESREKGVSIKNILKEKDVPESQYFWWRRKYSKPEVQEGFLPVSGSGLPAAIVNGNQKCSIFGNYECSDFGIKTAVDSATMVQ